MEDVIQHLDTAYKLLSMVAVRGDDAERLAVARQEMRAAYALLTEKKEANDG